MNQRVILHQRGKRNLNVDQLKQTVLWIAHAGNVLDACRCVCALANQ